MYVKYFVNILPKSVAFQCLTARELLLAYQRPIEQAITAETLLYICPAMLSQLDDHTCNHVADTKQDGKELSNHHHDDHHDHHHDNETEDTAVWVGIANIPLKGISL